jgi:hypothetical protein
VLIAAGLAVVVGVLVVMAARPSVIAARGPAVVTKSNSVVTVCHRVFGPTCAEVNTSTGRVHPAPG